MITLPKLTVIIGGAASGKSRFAENLLFAANKPLAYIATAQAFDDEMKTKIARHQAQRGTNWDTYEEPLAPWDALGKIDASSAVLLDCATLWLSNTLLGAHNLDAAKAKLFTGLQDFDGSVIIVTNELGQGVVPDNKLAREFRQQQGELNQELAAIADLVVLVTAGLPLALKGQLPQ
ncbi:MAG: bifunctional adenosylcobinamide kinase/adenosylcobinamide-phosphate guanylyltransferase [Amylibacter sp.]|nr:bifunctional adenosylcobinamide kinase/adenosylcobinamide-phosphate guanylyltransferase [Amylibacter sp.]